MPLLCYESPTLSILFFFLEQYQSNSFAMAEDKSGYALSVLWQIKK